MEVTIAQEIQQIEMEKPHVVILGAGASVASFPSGDKNGRIAPLMDDFIDILNLAPLLDKANIDYRNKNFEDVYSSIYGRKECDAIRQEIETFVSNYFSSFVISDAPCIYDHLVLSLRDKDVIATFNWDPFLMQAYLRNRKFFKLPRLLFLHGNVTVGFCLEDKELGINGDTCSKCRRHLNPTKLFYPISEKDYHNDPVIADQWHQLEFYIKNAFMLTIFGYGAPSSDVSAIALMKNAWGDSENRVLEEIEIIDTKDEEMLRKTWFPFIHSHHYQTYKNFYDSWISKHPRRTGEAHINQFLKGRWIENNPLPVNANFEELWSWFDVLYHEELKKQQHVAHRGTKSRN